MSKGRAEAVESATTVTELRSERRLKVRGKRDLQEDRNVALAFVDALRDILHDETRLAG